MNGVALTSFGLISLWTFVSYTGMHAHLAGYFIHEIAAFSLFAAFIGAALPALIAARAGYFAPLLLAGLCVTAPSLLFSDDMSVLYWVSGVMLLSFGWSVSRTYSLAVITRGDPSGRLVPFSNAMYGLGATIAPASAGYVLTTAGYDAFLLLCGSATLFGSSLFIAAHFLLTANSPRQRRAETPTKGFNVPQHRDPLAIKLVHRLANKLRPRRYRAFD